MTSSFIESAAGRAFIASADSRETSVEIMVAIARLVHDEDQAVFIWENGPTFSGICTSQELTDLVTDHGARPTTDFCWGVSGHVWYDAINH